MELNDYYDILELPPSANPAEIRKSYRRLALAYHPDRNPGDTYAAARFAIVKEAYEVLTDPAKRSLYHQERWLAKSNGHSRPTPPLNPETFLKRVLAKERSLARRDYHRINTSGITNELMTLFSSEAIEMLNRFDDEAINSEVVRLALLCATGLGYPGQQAFYEHLRKIKTTGSYSAVIDRKIDQSRRAHVWERTKIWLLLFLVTAICIFIFMVGR